MNERHEFQLSIELPVSEQANAPSAHESLSGMLKQDATVRVLDSATQPLSSASSTGDLEMRGLEWIGLLIGIFSSGAATALVQAIAACFQGPRLSKARIKIRDEKRGRTLVLDMTGLDKGQMDSTIATIKKFLEEAGVPAT